MEALTWEACYSTIYNAIVQVDPVRKYVRIPLFTKKKFFSKIWNVILFKYIYSDMSCRKRVAVKLLGVLATDHQTVKSS